MSGDWSQVHWFDIALALIIICPLYFWAAVKICLMIDTAFQPVLSGTGVVMGKSFNPSDEGEYRYQDKQGHTRVMPKHDPAERLIDFRIDEKYWATEDVSVDFFESVKSGDVVFVTYVLGRYTGNAHLRGYSRRT